MFSQWSLTMDVRGAMYTLKSLGVREEPCGTLQLISVGSVRWQAADRSVFSAWSVFVLKRWKVGGLGIVELGTVQEWTDEDRIAFGAPAFQPPLTREVRRGVRPARRREDMKVLLREEGAGHRGSSSVGKLGESERRQGRKKRKK
ncbi:hypothetical protein NDU88_001143 [Pleurodeles waltl]|uniref:Uncharacterized protein n=1 Tax=Pleurodeles waltl TaxID=8319 RepID=A0AAV7VVJ5_PLEWA|nr:hypothetical protein NDU88_001143 [Pleurodeles waltl]